MNMLSSIQLLQCTEKYLQFIPKQDLLLEELQALFYASKRHWNRCTNFHEKKLHQGQSYTIHFNENEPFEAVSFQDVSIVYENLYVIVAFKPAFLLVHSDGLQTDTLQARLNAYLMMQGWPYPCQAIHRIDKEASGLVLFCKHPFFQPFFDYQMQKHIIQKEYQCIVEGIFPQSIQVIDAPIARDRHNAKKMRIATRGKSCHTHIKERQIHGQNTMLHIQITTGRKHQIRVHLASCGYPIFNDPLYGTKKDDRGLLLQSILLSFKLPFDEQTITIQSPKDARMYL